MIEDNTPDIPIDELSDSIDDVIDSIFEEKQEVPEEEKINLPQEREEEIELWELIPENKVTAKVKCRLKDEGIFVEVNVDFKVEAIE